MATRLHTRWRASLPHRDREARQLDQISFKILACRLESWFLDWTHRDADIHAEVRGDLSENAARHRANFTHANIFSHVAQGAGQAPARFLFCVFSKTVIRHPRRL